MPESSQFVRKVLADEDSYILNGNSSNNVKAQFEFKEIKSPIAEKYSLFTRGKVLIPRWLVKLS